MSKILIVEDDPEIAMLERDYLEIEGFETQGGKRRKTARSSGWPTSKFTPRAGRCTRPDGRSRCPTGSLSF